MKLFILGSVSFILSISCVWLIRKLAYHYHWVAEPRKDRWHKRPVALYGGVGIFASFLVVGLMMLVVESKEDTFREIVVLFTGTTFVFLLGFLDDKKNFKPSTKLIGQITIASLPIATGLIFPVTPWHMINVLITYFWFVGIINAVNIIDNMDGLASGVVMISTLTIIAILIINGADSDNTALQLAIIFLCSVAGFWVLNKHPATIFMGDSGSLFMGYFLAAIAIPSKLNGFLGVSSSMFALFLPVTILAIPIFDTTLVTIMRKMEGRPAFLGGKDHSSHRLVELGFSERKAVLILYMLAAGGGIIAVLLRLWPKHSIVFFILYLILLCFVGIYLGRVKVSRKAVASKQEQSRTSLISELFYKRHAGAVILDVILIAVSYYIAYMLRFEGSPGGNAAKYMQSLPIVVASCMLSFSIHGIYRGVWNFISVADIGLYLKGAVFGTGIGMLIIVVLYRFNGYSRTVFIIFSGLLFFLMLGSRLFFQMLDHIVSSQHTLSARKNILIYGAGRGGRLLLRELRGNTLYKDYMVVGFIDDDRSKHNCSISDIRIFGQDFYSACQGMNIDELWISSSQITQVNIDALMKYLGSETKIKRFKIVIE
jgi:UDP-GlcNAc:undecaprenyl-phosphate GlcNAc-1-phosphate transferase